MFTSHSNLSFLHVYFGTSVLVWDQTRFLFFTSLMKICRQIHLYISCITSASVPSAGVPELWREMWEMLFRRKICSEIVGIVVTAALPDGGVFSRVLSCSPVFSGVLFYLLTHIQEISCPHVQTVSPEDQWKCQAGSRRINGRLITL